MPSTFAFYRPRGVPRNYLVEITLDPQPTEKDPPFEFTVSVAHVRTYNCGYCGTQSPSHTHTTTTMERSKKTGGVEVYEIGSGKHPEPMIIGDTITIEVRDPRIVPVQRLVYTASENGFTCTSQPFTINGHTWKPKEIDLQKIALVDWGNERGTIPEHNHAAPVPIPQPTPTPIVIAPEQSAAFPGLIKKGKYPNLSPEMIADQVRRFTKSDGKVDSFRLHEELRVANAMAAQHADEVVVPLVERQIQEILSRR